MTKEELIVMREKIQVIDTMENRGVVANHIVARLFSNYQLDPSNKNVEVLYAWLYNNIMGYTLSDAILTEFKVYVIRLVKKVCSDICYINETSSLGELLLAFNGYGEIGAFVNEVLTRTDYINLDNRFFDEVRHNSEIIGFEDTLILNQTTYVIDNTNRTCYVVKLHIKYHPNYTIDDLRSRINGRLHYHWRNIGVKNIYVEQVIDGSYVAQIIMFSDHDLDTINEMIAYRFGRTSGKPWYRCIVAAVDEQTPAND
jgi:hypothetical protein